MPPRTAEEHRLTVTCSDKYGWSRTAPGDPILQFVLDHMDELREIEMNRSVPKCQMVSIVIMRETLVSSQKSVAVADLPQRPHNRMLCKLVKSRQHAAGGTEDKHDYKSYYAGHSRTQGVGLKGLFKVRAIDAGNHPECTVGGKTQADGSHTDG